MDACYFENGHTVREGHNGSGHKHKTKYKSALDSVGSYIIQGANRNPGEAWGDNDKKYIEVGKTSLPFTEREKLGSGNILIKEENDSIKYKETRNVGGNDIVVYNNMPQPATVDLLPLLRI